MLGRYDGRPHSARPPNVTSPSGTSPPSHQSSASGRRALNVLQPSAGPKDRGSIGTDLRRACLITVVLWGRPSRADAHQGASYPAQVGQQSSRELASAGATTRAGGPRVQVNAISKAVPFPPCRDLQHLHRPSSPRLCSHAPALSRRGVRGIRHAAGVTA
jgi:hypothetical protein